jgi:glycosyltransferase involved in cell wall biosynthesis
VLVVDNNSTDETRAVSGDFCRRYPRRFRYLFEPQQGLSHARNAGVREARGEIIAFTDDDVTVESTWLQNLTAELDKGEWAGAGGRILPQETFVHPRWLSEEAFRMGGVLPLFDLGNIRGTLARPPYGANMAYRKAAFEKHGYFRVDLGRQGDSLLSGEEAEFALRLLRAGESLAYEPDAVVYHEVSEERLTKRYFQDWWFGLGRSSVRLSQRKPDLWKIPRPYLSILRSLFRMLCKSLRWIVSRQSDQRFYCKLQIWMLAGSVLEFWSQVVQPNKYRRNKVVVPEQQDVRPGCL